MLKASGQISPLAALCIHIMMLLRDCHSKNATLDLSDKPYDPRQFVIDRLHAHGLMGTKRAA